MSTASTKRARKRARAQARQQAEREEPASAAPAWRDTPELSERAWLYLSLGIILFAAILRIYALEMKPMHHDEGVNGFFLGNLLRLGVYKYDPANYHGPTLYYLTLPSVALFGLNTFAVRLVTALFGVATVGLMLYLRRYIGAVGALSAAALVAVSPGAVYYSRYFIHETLFVFFTVALVIAALRYWETGEALYLMLASAFTALMFATKETAFISAGVLLLATAVAWGWVYATRRSELDSMRRTRGKSGGKKLNGGEIGASGVAWRERFGNPTQVALLLGAALALFVFVNILFYSSFFTNAKGVSDALETFKVWSKTGTSDFHRKDFTTYVSWLKQEELPVLVLATIGSAAALFARRKNRFAIFAGAWAFGTWLAYSLIPYKTPWLMLSFTVPMAIAGGHAVQLAYDWSRDAKELRALVAVVLGFALAACVYQTAVLNFREYDNDQYPYVYAHTRREYVQMMREVERLTERAGTGRKTAIAIATPDYWPMPWYLRDNSGVAYDQNILPSYDADKTPIVIGKDDEKLPKLRSTLGAAYRQVGNVYPLRPGVNLVLFARADLVER